jgi:hypothetical protein
VYLWNLAKKQLCTDDDTWVPVDRFEATTKVKQYLSGVFVEIMGEEICWELLLRNGHSHLNKPRVIR